MIRRDQYACLLVREFPAQAIVRLRPELREVPFVLLEVKPPLQTVLSLNTRARLLGVRHGMTKVEVESFEGVVSVARSSAAEISTKTALLECASAFTPRMEVRDETRCFLCCMDITGSETLFGPAEMLAKRLRARCATLGLSVQIVSSSDFHSSILLAKSLPARVGVSVVNEEDKKKALAPLPLSVLNLSQTHEDTFAMWGIRTLGALAELPQAQLIARLGQEAKRLQQVAAGTLPHLFAPIDVPFVLEERVDLDDPLDNLESLLFGVAILLDHLIVRTAQRIYALASVTVALDLEGGAVHRRTVSPRVPTNDKHLWLKLLRLDLEAHPPPASIVRVCVHAEPGTRSEVQLGLFTPQLPEPGPLELTLARIAAIVGEENVGSPALDDTHTDGFHLKPFTIEADERTTVPTERGHTCLRRMEPPLATSMETADGKPARFHFRGKKFRVEHSYGPWLMGGAWWADCIWGREQWDLIARGEDETVLYCCVIRDFVRDAWHVAGLYD